MTEKRREYLREWKKKNRDKVRQYEKNTAIRAVIAAIEAGTLKVDDVRVLR